LSNNYDLILNKLKQLKMKKLFLSLMAIAVLSMGFISCDKDEETSPQVNNEPMPTEKTIVQLAQENGFNSLAEALVRADLVSPLDSEGDFTVFAPTDEAFDALLSTIGQESIQDVPIEVLQQILLYHVVPSSVLSTEISTGKIATLQGSDIELSLMDGIAVNGANVQTPFDVEASNGVIHTVDQVLVPAAIGQFVNTVLEPAYFNNNFTTLISAAVKADLVATLLNTPNLSIFAPSNSVFDASGIVVADTDKETLAAVLAYHVIGVKVMSTEIPREATTVNGKKMYFTLTENGAYINGNTMITGVDIESGSGVVHLIDQVLLPPSGNLVETAVSLSEQGQFTSLVAALSRTASEGTEVQDLITVLNDDGPFTVFAPTDEAFQALLDSKDEWNTLNDIPLETLVDVLTYHVVPARAFDKDLATALENDQLPTALGKTITIDLNTLTINDNANIIGVNTNTTNGVIHVINSVLLP
jgi:transforming growth factor-beta-induced protein